MPMAIMPRTVFSSSKQLMSPAWSPDGNRLAYVSFEGGNSAIYVQDVKAGRRVYGVCTVWNQQCACMVTEWPLPGTHLVH